MASQAGRFWQFTALACWHHSACAHFGELRCCCRTALHRALYYGNFRCAAALLAANAQMSLTDFKVRHVLSAMLGIYHWCLIVQVIWGFLCYTESGVVYLISVSLYSTCILAYKMRCDDGVHLPLT